MSFLHNYDPQLPPIKNYWVWYKVGNYSKVRGSLKSDGAFHLDGYPISEMMPHDLGENIFETELDCVNFILSFKKDAVEALRIEIDKLEEKKGKLIWPETKINPIPELKPN